MEDARQHKTGEQKVANYVYQKLKGFIQRPVLLVRDLVTRASIHAGLAFPTHGLGVRVLVRPVAKAAMATVSASSLLNLLEATADGLEGDEDGVVVVGGVGGELIRNVDSHLVAANRKKT